MLPKISWPEHAFEHICACREGVNGSLFLSISQRGFAFCPEGGC